jgi:hypothetical protein
MSYQKNVEVPQHLLGKMAAQFITKYLISSLHLPYQKVQSLVYELFGCFVFGLLLQNRFSFFGVVMSIMAVLFWGVCSNSQKKMALY